MNTTQEQKEILLNWMKLHPEVAKGRLCRKRESKKEMEKLLQQLSNAMNSVRQGPNKSSSEWLKTWKDWKMYVLKKETKWRNSSLRIGGGSPKQINFSPLEENLLEFLTPEAAGLQDIPEGGLYENQNQNFDSQENTMEYLDEGMEEQNENVARNANVIRIGANMSKTNTFQNEKLLPMIDRMIRIQEEKLHLKEEELNIQRQLLEIHKCTLSEIQKIRSALDMFCSLQESITFIYDKKRRNKIRGKNEVKNKK